MKWFLAFFLWLLVVEAPAAPRPRTPEIPIQSSRSLRQQVDSYAELLEKEVVKGKNSKEKYRSVKRVLGQIRALRENSSPQGALDESHMDLLVSVLESIPNEGKFKKKECEKYQSDFMDQFEPTAEEEPQNPAVKPGWTVLQSMCN